MFQETTGREADLPDGKLPACDGAKDPNADVAVGALAGPPATAAAVTAGAGTADVGAAAPADVAGATAGATVGAIWGLAADVTGVWRIGAGAGAGEGEGIGPGAE